MDATKLEWNLSNIEEAWEFVGGELDDNGKPYPLNPMDDGEILKLVQEAYFLGMKNAAIFMEARAQSLKKSQEVSIKLLHVKI